MFKNKAKEIRQFCRSAWAETRPTRQWIVEATRPARQWFAEVARDLAKDYSKQALKLGIMVIVAAIV